MVLRQFALLILKPARVQILLSMKISGAFTDYLLMNVWLTIAIRNGYLFCSTLFLKIDTNFQDYVE